MKGRKENKPGKFASGGGVHKINGEGSPLMAAGMKTSSEGFKDGGATPDPKAKKLKTGGLVSGKAPAARLDKRARGGRTPDGKFASGGGVYSSGKSQSDRMNTKNSGHESSGPA